MGQREAARLTQEQFDLVTFSHTTLGRVMKALEISIEEAEAGVKVYDNTINDAIDDKGVATRQKPMKRFPSVSDTAARRNSLTGFFSSFNKNAKTMNIIVASRILVMYWYDKYKRLLI